MTNKFSFIDAKFIAAHLKATGIKIIPTIFPWRWLDCTDEEFMGTELKFSHGPVIPAEHKLKLLACIRLQEKELMEEHKRETVIGKVPKYVQLELWPC